MNELSIVDRPCNILSRTRKNSLQWYWCKRLSCLSILVFAFSFVIGVWIAICIKFAVTKILFICDDSALLKTEASHQEKFPNNSDKNLVFVGIMTAQQFMNSRIPAVYESWAGDVPGEVAIYGNEMAFAYGKIPLIRLDGTDDTYPPQKKSFMMLKHMYEHYLDNFEFFMRTDDDVYIRPDKLELFLRSLNSSKPLLIGQPGKGLVEEFGDLSLLEDENFCMGGPGVIMSKVTLAKIGPHIKDCLQNLYSLHEDVEISRCVRNFAGLSCTWSYEVSFLLKIYYYNF